MTPTTDASGYPITTEFGQSPLQLVPNLKAAYPGTFPAPSVFPCWVVSSNGTSVVYGYPGSPAGITTATTVTTTGFATSGYNVTGATVTAVNLANNTFTVTNATNAGAQVGGVVTVTGITGRTYAGVEAPTAEESDAEPVEVAPVVAPEVEVEASTETEAAPAPEVEAAPAVDYAALIEDAVVALSHAQASGDAVQIVDAQQVLDHLVAENEAAHAEEA